MLTAMDSNGRLGSTVYHADSLSPQAVEPLEHVFLLRSTARTPLVLDHLQTSCPCTTAALVDAAEGATITPGGTFSVRVDVDPKRLAPGLLHKSVWVFVQGQDAPAATLEVTGALLPTVSFSPPSLNFGKLEKGAELTLLLQVTSQTPRLDQGTELRLVSADPDVSVTGVPSSTPAAGTGLALPAASAFRVHLAPHTHVGRLQGRLSLILVHTGDPAGTAGPVVSTISWLGEAAGAISAVPSFVAFGTPVRGQAATKKCVLTGKGLGKEVSSLVCTSTNPFVSATLKPMPGSADQTELEARLAPNALLGPLDARLIVTERNGEQLILPVFAVVKQ